MVALAFALVKVVAPVDEPKSSKSLLVNVFAAVKVCARFSSSTVPVLAGNVTVKFDAPAFAVVNPTSPPEPSERKKLPCGNVLVFVKVFAAPRVAPLTVTAVPLTKRPVALTVPAPSFPPVGEPTTIEAGRNARFEAATYAAICDGVHLVDTPPCTQYINSDPVIVPAAWEPVTNVLNGSCAWTAPANNSSNRSFFI